MKRRNAIKNIVVISSGLVIFPACEMGKTSLSVYENLSLDQDQFNLIDHLADAILPKGDLEITNPESTKEFILNMINDCYSPEDCEKYVAGLKAFVILVNEKYSNVLSKIGTDKKLELFKLLSESEKANETSKYFLNTTRRLALQHFTGSEYFLSQHMNWKFIPGDYEGCVSK